MKEVFQTKKLIVYIFINMVIAGFLICNYSYANTYYVAKTGNDTTGNGSLSSPYLTVQKGINMAYAGDTVFVKPGVYRERLTFPRSGSSGNPIVLRGEIDSTTGEKLAVIDGGTLLTGWTKVAGGGNIWRVPYDTSIYVGDLPYNLNINNDYILQIQSNILDSSEKMNVLQYGPLGWDSYGDADHAYRSWNGIEAMWGWGTNENYMYIAFGDLTINPNQQVISYTLDGKRGGSVITIDAKKFITISGLTLRNGYNSVFFRHVSTDCVVENNFMMGGKHNVEIWEGSSRIIVRNNDITLGYVHPLSPNDSRHWFIWAAFKENSYYDRVAINLDDVGSDVDISGNYIYEHWDGVQNVGTSTRLKVHDNIIVNLGDDGLEPTGGETDAQWYDNIVSDANIAYRHKVPDGNGTMYVYRNKFYSKKSTGIYWFGGNTTPAYFYHNTFATGTGTTFGADNGIGLPNVKVINNIFSCNSIGFSASSTWLTLPMPIIENNYFGGDRSTKLSWWGNNNKVVQNGQLWSLTLEPDFEITSTSPARQMGLDLSQPWTIGSTTYPALPGMEPGYYEGTLPDAGAFQYEAPKVSVIINQSASQLDPTNGSSIVFDVVFSKPISGFLSNDIILSGTAGATTAVLTSSGDYMNYSVTVSGMTQSGTVIASIPALAAWDKTNSAYKSAASTSTDNIVDYDITSPSVTINQDVAQLDPTTTSPILFKAVFSEPVTGFTSSDIVLSGTAQASSVVVTDSGDHKNYSVSVSGFTQTGTVVATIPAGSAQDLVENLSAASSSTDNTITYNGIIAPTVTINQDTSQLDPATTSPIVFKVVFSKPISGFLNSDIILSGSAGATTAVLTSSGDYMNYSVAVSGMTQSGTVIASIPALAAWDKVNSANKSVASTSTDNVVMYSDSVSVSGSIDLQSFYADKSGVSGTVDIRDSASGEVVESHPITLDASGNYSFTTSRTGDYTLAAKCSHWLSDAKNVSIALSGNVVNFSLINGDCNNDNAVDEGDFGMLSNAWYSSVGDLNFDARVDLNSDGAIDEGDFGILSNSWYQSGN